MILSAAFPGCWDCYSWNNSLWFGLLFSHSGHYLWLPHAQTQLRPTAGWQCTDFIQSYRCTLINIGVIEFPVLYLLLVLHNTSTSFFLMHRTCWTCSVCFSKNVNKKGGYSIHPVIFHVMQLTVSTVEFN